MEATNTCVLEKPPLCPKGSRQLGATGDCLSDEESQCLGDSHHSEDFKDCVVAEHVRRCGGGLAEACRKMVEQPLSHCLFFSP